MSLTISQIREAFLYANRIGVVFSWEVILQKTINIRN